MSTLMFWNKQNGNANQTTENGGGGGGGKTGKKTWLHAPDALLNGHVAYLVKFLGSTPVDQAKGIDTVKDAIRRLQFSQQIKKAESGTNVKTKKVEITISVDGVAVQEPRGTKILHQFPLHNISYCADEKGVKKFFSFIAKTHNNSTVPNEENNSNNNTEESHECFVFISSKLASDITLTIGQAFELAYRRYMTDSGKGTEVQKLQTHNKQLENQISAYRQRLKDLTELVAKSELERILLRYGLKDIFELPQHDNGSINGSINGSNTPDLGIDVSSPTNDDQLLIETSNKHFAPIVPPRNLQNQISSTLEALKPSVGTKLEGLLLNSDSDSDFDPRADENDMIMNGNGISDKFANDSFFGFEPPKATLGQQLFVVNNNNNNNNNNQNTNNNNNQNGLTNGSVNGNGYNNGTTNSSPPLLAPPPKAAIPRRTTNGHATNNGTNGNQDLFGSTPFDAPLQPSPFNVVNDQVPTSTSPPLPKFSRIDAAFGVPLNSPSEANAESSFGSSSSFSMVANPFTDSSSSSSGFGDNSSDSFGDASSPSGSQQHVLTDLTAFSNNFDKLDGILNHFNGTNADANINANTITTTTTTTSTTATGKANTFNPFAMGGTKSPALNELKGMEFSQSMPDSQQFGGQGVFNIDFDAIRATLESDAHNLPCPSDMGSITNDPKTDDKAAMDFFKDAAAAAFSEFGTGAGKSAFKFNRSGGAINGSNSNSFDGIAINGKTNFNNNNNNKLSFAADDFTLESLDPLRK